MKEGLPFYFTDEKSGSTRVASLCKLIVDVARSQTRVHVCPFSVHALISLFVKYLSKRSGEKTTVDKQCQPNSGEAAGEDNQAEKSKHRGSERDTVRSKATLEPQKP